jgi:hypothetical protein
MVGPCLYPLACEYEMCVGIIFEQWKGCWDKPLGDALAPPNQTRSEHVQTHGSVDERHVPGNDGHLCPCLQRGLQWLKYSSYSFNNPCLLTSQNTSKRMLFSSRFRNYHMMILKGCLFILGLGVDTNTTVLLKFA